MNALALKIEVLEVFEQAQVLLRNKQAWVYRPRLLPLLPERRPELALELRRYRSQHPTKLQAEMLRALWQTPVVPTVARRLCLGSGQVRSLLWRLIRRGLVVDGGIGQGERPRRSVRLAVLTAAGRFWLTEHKP